MFEACWICF